MIRALAPASGPPRCWTHHGEPDPRQRRDPMAKAATTLAPEPILALAERMKAHATKMTNRRQHHTAADCRLASRYLQRLASLAIVDQAHAETDPARKRDLEAEAADL